MANCNRTSLRALLTRQWMIFAAAAAAIVAAGALLLAYLVEDGLIDQRLLKIAGQLATLDAAQLQLPPELAVYDRRKTPIDIAPRLKGVAEGEVFEMRRANGSNIHVVLAKAADSRPIVVTYDATEITVVRSAIGSGLIAALGLTLLFLLAAWFMADRLSRRVARHAELLESSIRSSESPSDLHAVADRQQLMEFGSLLHLHAALWERERLSVDNERATLAYLAHELRTPLQSAINSVAAMADGENDAATLARLRRAIARLERASSAALWLATEQPPEHRTSILLGPVLAELTAEFEPLARIRGQSFVRGWDADAQCDAPVEIVEAVVANLLHNAVRHGAPGTVEIHARDDQVMISNALRGSTQSDGFGFGLEIVRRLCERLGGNVQVAHSEGRFSVTLAFCRTGLSE